jgi:hypothetical protein
MNVPQQYSELIPLGDKIPFKKFIQTVKDRGYIKLVQEIDTTTNSAKHKDLDKRKAESIFNNNVITYFPAYRYEIPGYLNDPYKIHLNFTKESEYSGYLPNPIEVVSELPQLANWIMDVMLDRLNYKQEKQVNIPNQGITKIDTTPEQIVIMNSLNLIINSILSSKNQGSFRFGIGKRNSGGSRIAVAHSQTGEIFYPTVFNLSSGETTVLCTFGEILRQADKTRNNTALRQISGIVLIDEVDKHLHLRLQKEVLPQLFNLFPNVQFVVSSHSPFLNMGLAELEGTKNRTKIIDLDNGGIITDVFTNDLYKEVYGMIIDENNRFAKMYNDLSGRIQQSTKPLIITEGKTDIKHLKKAQENLSITDCDVEYCDIPEGKWCDDTLKKYLANISKIKPNRKIIGIFDRDVPDIISEVEKNGQPYKHYSNNVYAFCIPCPDDRKNYSNISIKFYYSDAEIQREKNGRRLYFDNEMESLYNKTKSKSEYRRLDEPNIEKEHSKKIFDEDKMCEVTDWIHSKSNFATLIETDEEFAKEFDFSNFKLIFDKIKSIINLS